MVGPTSGNSIISQVEDVIAFSFFYGLPIYAPMAFAAECALRRWGTAWVPRWLVIGPLVFAAIWVAALLLLIWVVGLLSPNPAEVSFTSDPPVWRGMLALIGIVLGYAYALSAVAYAGHRMIFGRGAL